MNGLEPWNVLSGTGHSDANLSREEKMAVGSQNGYQLRDGVNGAEYDNMGSDQKHKESFRNQNRRSFLQNSSKAFGSFILGIRYTSSETKASRNGLAFPVVDPENETLSGVRGQQGDEQSIDQLKKAYEAIDELIRQCFEAKDEAFARNNLIRQSWVQTRIEGTNRCNEVYLEDFQAWGDCIERLPDEPEFEFVDCSELISLGNKLQQKVIDAERGEDVPKPEGDRPETPDEDLETDAADQREQEYWEEKADVHDDVVNASGFGAAGAGLIAIVLPPVGAAVAGGVGVFLLGVAVGQWLNYRYARDTAQGLARGRRSSLTMPNFGIYQAAVGVLGQRTEETALSSIGYSYEQVNLFERWPIDFADLDDAIPLGLQEFAKKSMYLTFALRDYVWSWARYDIVSSIRQELQPLDYIEPDFLWSLARSELEQIRAIAHNAQRAAELSSELVALRSEVNSAWGELTETITESEEWANVTAEELKQQLVTMWSDVEVRLELQERYNLDSAEFFTLIEQFEEFLNQATFQRDPPDTLLDADWENVIQTVSENLTSVSEIHYELAAVFTEDWDFPSTETTTSPKTSPSATHN